MTAGRLAADKPGATTNTVLYKCNTIRSGSTVLNVCNQGSGSASYRAALRDYDQVLHLDGTNTSTYKLVQGNPITGYKLKLNPGFQDANAIPGATILTTNGAEAKILDVFKPTNDVELFTQVKEISLTNLQADSLAGTLQGGETLTLSGSGTVGDENVANGQAVTLGSLALVNGTGLASNYSLNSASLNLSLIHI